MPNNNETTTKFKVDISELKSAMQEAKRQIQVTNSEFKAISSGMDNWAKSTDGISAKLKQLGSNLNSQKSVLSSLERQYELTVAQMGEGSAEADRLKIAINNQKAVVNGTQKEINKYEQALDELGNTETEAGNDAEDLGKKTKKAGDDAKSAGDGFTVFKGVLANLATQGINLALDGIKSLGGAMVNMVKESVSAYADYEQLVGGVDTLFKDSSKLVQKYASNAYKTAGMSANEYMETVTSFSASLLSALGGDTKKSAEVADMAITDMSDNANKMGTSMEMIQNAYNGFAKGNFTMLDNLKLGYGGTQEEMKRLLKDAEALSGQKYDISNLNDVFQAIHVIQGELDITGTTAKEASSTISGSVDSMKSAWQNFLAGVANGDADMSQLTKNLVDGVKTVIKNLAPVVKEAVGTLFEIVKNELPPALKELYEAFKSMLPPELQDALGKVETALQWIIDNKDVVIAGLAGIGTAIAGLGLVALIGNFGKFIELIKAWSVVTKLQTGLQTALNVVMSMNPIGILIALIAGLVTAFVVLWNKSDAFREFWINLWETVKSACATAWEAISLFFTETIPALITSIGEWFSQLPTVIGTWLSSVITKVATWASELAQKGSESATNFVNKIVEWFRQLPEKIWTWLTNVITKVSTWATNLAQKGKEAGQKLMDSIIDKVKEIPDKIKTIGSDIVKGLWNGINDMASWIKEKIQGFGDNVLGALKDFFGINSPSKLMEEEIGKFLPMGIAVGIDKNAKSVMNAMKDLTMNTLGATRNGLSELGVNGEITGGVVNNFTQVINSPKQLSRLEIYRQSKNLLGYAGGGM